MIRSYVAHATLALVAIIVTSRQVEAQFLDEFDGPISDDWTWFTGDGLAEMDFLPQGEYATIHVDATADTNNIWWALIKRDVSKAVDLKALTNEHHELRIEAMIRVSAAPRRVNLSVNTQRTTDFHSNLMEFDIPDTDYWYIISMTTDGFDGGPGDQINAQMALMDWGIGTYDVDVNYFRVDIVDVRHAREDMGGGVPYHPPVPDTSTFEFSRKPVDVVRGEALTVDRTDAVTLFWDLSEFKGQRVDGGGILEFTTEVVSDSGYNGDGLFRIAEAGNPQMIIDVSPQPREEGRTRATLSLPALQRLIAGKTTGLDVRSLLGLEATIRDPVLYFNLK